MAVAMQFDTLIFETREGIAYVTLNRPDRLNALSDPLVEDLRRAAAVIESNADIRAVLLTGAGRAFCAGADLTGDNTAASPPQPLAGSTGERIRASMQKHFNPMVNAWYQLRVPVVVAEAEPGLTYDLRASTLHCASLDVLAPLGVTERLMAMLGPGAARRQQLTAELHAERTPRELRLVRQKV